MVSDFPEERFGEGASTRSWIFAFAAILLMLVGFAYYKKGPEFFTDFLSANDQEEQNATVVAELDSKKAKKSKRKKRRKKSGRKGRAKTGVDGVEGVDWNNDDDWNDPGIQLGDVSEQQEHQIETEPAKPPPKYKPTKAEYQPSGKYTPTAGYHESGASTGNVSSLNMASGGSNKGLSDADVRSKLTVGKLMPCYSTLAAKVPEMGGTVNFKMIVEADGHVSSVKITRSELRSRVVEKCMVNRIKKIRFPKRDRASKFSQSFSFR